MGTKNSVQVLIIIFFSFGLQAQSVLDGYIKEGLRNNESIKQQNFLLEKNLFALKEAKSLFFPNTSFNASYLKAAGGRTVDFPIGDLLNPVYHTLNQLTGSNGFPAVKNQSILLNPDNFYDARISTTLPIVNAEIRYNQKIKSQQLGLQELEIDLYKRELVKEIKTAYYRYVQATEAVKIYENAVALVKESQRINRALFKNHKINRTAVIRSDNEVSKIESEQFSAIEKQRTASAYLNFLLNRPLDSQIMIDTIGQAMTYEAAIDTSAGKREELQKLATVRDITANSIRLAKSYIVPKVNAFLDLGSQGFNWQFNNKNVYYLFGISLDWTLFSFRKNTYRIKQAEADLKAIEAQTNYAEAQLRLQLVTAVHNYNAAVSTHRAAQSTMAAAEKYYNDVLRLYKEGMALFIELLDAQNEYIDTRLRLNIAFYDVNIRSAEIERANAGFNLENE